MSHKLLVFVSGSGTNLQAIIDACQTKVLAAQVVHVISNKKSAFGLERATKHNISTSYYPYISDKMSRDEYDLNLYQHVATLDYDMIVLAGWMHVFGPQFLSNIKKPIINLHPALPGQFPGNDGIGDAYSAFKLGKCTKTGAMVHYVVEEVDAGAIIDTCEVPILENDTEDDLRNRVRYYEKPLLIHAIQKELVKLTSDHSFGVSLDSLKSSTTTEDSNGLNKYYVGKVRDVYDIGHNLLAIVSTNRQSAFDRHICEIPGKGNILTNVSAWWFNNTRHIIDNHYIYHAKNVMIVKKCIPFKVEVVVRGYMTGSTNTSLWTYYSKGEKYYCGGYFRDGYVKNEKLDYNVVTPTTKDVSDKPISGKEVVEMGLMNDDDWLDVHDVALKLFEYGQMVSKSRGLILVDTKYEFGRDEDGKIILIDELHTCDSSRFWDLSTYEANFSQGLEPKKFDKDIVREWLRKECNPYKDELPEIPKELIDTANEAYNEFERKLVRFEWVGGLYDYKEYQLSDIIQYYYDNVHDKVAVILSGSVSDKAWVQQICNELNNVGMYHQEYVASAHKNTRQVLDILDKYEKRQGKVVLIAVAGRSNALGGIASAYSKWPVINCPPFANKLDMMTNINSSIQNPSNVPAATILEPQNVALFVKKICKY